MSWAAKRQTTEVEDIAYCLLGIFGVNMPLIYGEGENAFVRLQEEIMRNSSDQTILAWTVGDSSQLRSRSSPLAPNPNCFDPDIKINHVSGVSHFSYRRKPFLLINMGIQIQLPIIRTSEIGFWAVLDCHKNGKPLCIPLRLIGGHDTQFQKVEAPNMTIDKLEGFRCEVSDIYLNGWSICSTPGNDKSIPIMSTPDNTKVMERNASGPFLAGRWRTETQEKKQIVAFFTDSASGRAITTSVFASFEFRFLLIGMLIVETCGRVVDKVILLDPLLVMTWFGQPLLRGSLILRVQLLILGGLSVLGARLETPASFWRRQLWQGTKRNDSAIRRYHIHHYDELLRGYWREEISYVIAIILGYAMFWFGPDFIGEAVTGEDIDEFSLSVLRIVKFSCPLILVAFTQRWTPFRTPEFR